VVGVLVWLSFGSLRGLGQSGGCPRLGTTVKSTSFYGKAPFSQLLGIFGVGQGIYLKNSQCWLFMHNKLGIVACSYHE